MAYIIVRPPLHCIQSTSSTTMISSTHPKHEQLYTTPLLAQLASYTSGSTEDRATYSDCVHCPHLHVFGLLRLLHVLATVSRHGRRCGFLRLEHGRETGVSGETTVPLLPPCSPRSCYDHLRYGDSTLASHRLQQMLSAN